MSRCDECPAFVECWQHEETNCAPCDGIDTMERMIATLGEALRHLLYPSGSAAYRYDEKETAREALAAYDAIKDRLSCTKAASSR